MSRQTLKACAILGALLAVAFFLKRWLKPIPDLTGPYLLAAFFQFQMSAYVRKHRQSPPPAFTLFSWVGFAGMLFECGFLGLVWIRFGLTQAVAIGVVTFVVVAIWSLFVRWSANGPLRDLEMWVNFGGLVGLPIAGYIAVTRALQLGPIGG